MAIQFQRLATPGDGVSTLLDFAPLAAGIRSYQDNEKNALIGNAARTGGNTAAAAEAMKQGQLDTGAQYQRLASQDKDRATADKDRQVKMLGGVAQAAKYEKDPARRALIWQTGLKRAGVNPADLDPDELDPMTGPDVFLAASGMAQDPRESQLMDLKIAQANKDLRSPVGGDAPSSVREWQYFNSLPDDQKPQYLAMKRAQQTLDLGDRFGVLNPTQPGQVATEIPKNLADAEAQKEIGTALGKQAAAAPSDMSSADAALDLVESIRNDPNRSAGTSTLSPVGNLIPKTPGFAFEKKVEQAKSGAFLTAIQQLRGMGALSNAEGQTATAAVTRMTTATDDAAFEEALQDYEKTILRGRRSAEKIMKERDRLMGGQRSSQPAPSSGGQRARNPQTGEEVEWNGSAWVPVQ